MAPDVQYLTLQSYIPLSSFIPCAPIKSQDAECREIRHGSHLVAPLLFLFLEPRPVFFFSLCLFFP